MAKRGRERERGRCVVKGRGHVYTEVGGVVVGQGVWYGRKWSWMRHVCMCVYMCGVGVCEAWTSAVANSRWLVLFSLDRRGGGGSPIDPHFSPVCVCVCARVCVHMRAWLQLLQPGWANCQSCSSYTATYHITLLRNVFNEIEILSHLSEVSIWGLSIPDIPDKE